jgi:RimJ/RimL family protein N-acetyltransferase
MNRDGKTSVGDHSVLLREITRDDAELLYRWRMHDASRPMFCSTGTVAYEAHLAMLEAYFDEANTDRWYMVEVEGEPLGAIALVDVSADGSEAEWGRGLVEPTARGRGFGRRTFELLIDHCRDIGYSRVYAEVLEQNEVTLHLVEHVGFRRCGVRVADDGRRFVQVEQRLGGDA